LAIGLLSFFAVRYMITSMQLQPDAGNANGQKYVPLVREFPPHLPRFMNFYFGQHSNIRPDSH
jgi:hypothetical protein